MDIEIHVSPRMLCPCGKSIRRLTQDERESFDDAQRRLAETAETKETQKQRRAAYDAAQRMFAGTSDGQSTDSSPCDDARQEWSTRDPVERTTEASCCASLCVR